MNKIIKGKLKFRNSGGTGKRKAEKDVEDLERKTQIIQFVRKKYKEEEEEEKAENSQSEEADLEEQKIMMGTGSIFSSGATVHGKDTKFLKELHAGDNLIIKHPLTLLEERQRITMVLSNHSLGIANSFSTDLSTPMTFNFQKESIKKEKKQVYEEVIAARLDKYAGVEDRKEENKATIVDFRTKSGEYWRNKREIHKGVLTREEMLDIRVTKGGDKFC